MVKGLMSVFHLLHVFSFVVPNRIKYLGSSLDGSSRLATCFCIDSPRLLPLYVCCLSLFSFPSVLQSSLLDPMTNHKSGRRPRVSSATHAAQHPKGVRPQVVSPLVPLINPLNSVHHSVEPQNKSQQAIGTSGLGLYEDESLMNSSAMTSGDVADAFRAQVLAACSVASSTSFLESKGQTTPAFPSLDPSMGRMRFDSENLVQPGVDLGINHVSHGDLGDCSGVGETFRVQVLEACSRAMFDSRFDNIPVPAMSASESQDLAKAPEVDANSSLQVLPSTLGSAIGGERSIVSPRSPTSPAAPSARASRIHTPLPLSTHTSPRVGPQSEKAKPISPRETMDEILNSAEGTGGDGISPRITSPKSESQKSTSPKTGSPKRNSPKLSPKSDAKAQSPTGKTPTGEAKTSPGIISPKSESQNANTPKPGNPKRNSPKSSPKSDVKAKSPAGKTPTGDTVYESIQSTEEVSVTSEEVEPITVPEATPEEETVEALIDDAINTAMTDDRAEANFFKVPDNTPQESSEVRAIPSNQSSAGSDQVAESSETEELMRADVKEPEPSPVDSDSVSPAVNEGPVLVPESAVNEIAEAVAEKIEEAVEDLAAEPIDNQESTDSVECMEGSNGIQQVSTVDGVPPCPQSDFSVPASMPTLAPQGPEAESAIAEPVYNDESQGPLKKKGLCFCFKC
jgi:hypothetical protein